jgi:hypothetical protein
MTAWAGINEHCVAGITEDDLLEKHKIPTHDCCSPLQKKHILYYFGFFTPIDIISVPVNNGDGTFFA